MINIDFINGTGRVSPKKEERERPAVGFWVLATRATRPLKKATKGENPYSPMGALALACTPTGTFKHA
jgi:hypothetical protein